MSRANVTSPAQTTAKIISLDDMAALAEKLRQQGKRIVQSHGVFDLLHVGHIRHFQQAKRFGDVLIVTLTPDRYVNKGPHRPAFKEELRAETIASLECVDYVVINQWPQAMEVIGLIKPHFYAKGPDYKDKQKDRTGGIFLEEQAVQLIGGQLVTTDDVTFSSTNLINNHLQPHSPETQAYLKEFIARHSVDDIISYLDRLQSIRVLVIGETIIDEYQYVEAIGKSSKEPTLAVKLLSTDVFAGGVLAIANHAAAFSNTVGVITQLGEHNSHQEFVKDSLQKQVTLLPTIHRGANTIVKRRYIDKYFFTKLFETYEMTEGGASTADEKELLDVLARHLHQYDAVIVADYGHGMLSDKIIRFICDHAKFLSVNTQSNAGNLGYHTISRYPKMNHVSIAENELRLEARDRQSDVKNVIARVAEKVNCDTFIVTRGKRGSLCRTRAGTELEVPALASKVVDRVGAGDTFLAVTALCLAADVPLEVTAFLGNMAGAQAVATVGNSRSLDRVSFIRHIESLLK